MSSLPWPQSPPFTFLMCSTSHLALWGKILELGPAGIASLELLLGNQPALPSDGTTFRLTQFHGQLL